MNKNDIYKTFAVSDCGPVIKAKGLVLTFNSPNGELVGVGTSPEGLSFEVNKGEIFGIIGPDGAGKSTLFRILCSLMLPQKGTANVAGYDVDKDYKKLRKVIGYMPGNFSLYSDLSVEENLKFFATIFDTTIEENYHLIKDIYSQIKPFKDRKAMSLSGGMKQKLALSCALIHKPIVLFLDEPTTGIDPISRVDLWNTLHKLSDNGVTIVVSTPYMDEAAQCDRIVFMQKGTFMVDAVAPQELAKKYPYPIYEIEGDDRLDILEQISHLPNVVNSFAFGNTFHVTTEKGITEDIIAEKMHDCKVKIIKPGLEDAFLLLSRSSE